MSIPGIYLDYAAASPVHPQVLEAMLPYFSERFANPSTIHKMGVEARQAVESARSRVAKLINAHADEMIFTSGATESINLALLGTARANRSLGKHVISSTAEHTATLEVLKSEGFDVTLLPVDEYGMVDVTTVLSAVRPDTILISLLFVNNEVGTINPIAEIGKGLIKFRKASQSSFPLLHVDAAQAIVDLAVDVELLHADLLSFSSGKIGGPKGVGALYVRRGTKIEPLLLGGKQERSLRPGTENVPAIVGFGAAAGLIVAERAAMTEHVTACRAAFLDTLTAKLDNFTVNSHPTACSPHILNISFPGLEAEELILRLDAHGVYISAAAACSKADSWSHVLEAMGFPPEALRSSVRFSFGRETTVDAAVTAAGIVARVVDEMRARQ